ncbi:MAG: NAD(P)H-dependent glycerol-3-phosphate dehydrogenase [Bacteroidales bacterium]|jgi:glycerol-3-phosphate dehydrogenase (NAD(P)+)|nr:NAD(P)H-dependent glycerol-3-phosphate dehydrogenase [Bacteroidales bacterium]
MKIAVLGGGSWATAIVKIASENHNEVFWWVREKAIEKSVRKYGYNALYLRSCELDSHKIHISTKIEDIVTETKNIVLVIPSAFLADSLKGLTNNDFKGKNVISAVKGIVPQTNRIVADFLYDKYGLSMEHQAVVSGPSHAEEIAAQRLTYLTIGSKNETLAKHFATKFACRYVKTTTSTDITGIEYGGVLKNIYALAAGICKGLNYGDNFVSVLITRAIVEMETFLDKIAPCEERNINRSVYLGDLLVTAYSQHSRNRTFGQMLGQGYSIASAQLEMSMIAEGYYASKSIHAINQSIKAHIPIADAVYRILYEDAPANTEIKQLSESF